MPNIENLKYKDGERHQLTEEEVKKGNANSIESRRKKKSMQELANIILNLSLKSGEVHSIEEMQSIAEISGKNLSVDEAILLKQVEKALKGDLQSATFIRDTSGNKPVEQIQHSGEINNPYTNLTEEELHKLAGE